MNPAHLEPVTPQQNQLRSPLTPSSINAAKTHCPAGHPYAGNNLIVTRNGRVCRACKLVYDRERQRRYKARKRQPS